MIHDLTRDSVFHKENGFLNHLTRINIRADFESPEPYRYEALLTGDAFERMSKRFALDYESDQELCDCCGGPITIKPWAFSVIKLCQGCNDELEKTFRQQPFSDPKPWEFVPDREDKPTDNIFLWD